MKKILIIEDEKNIRETLQDILEIKGYEVLLAADGDLGLLLAEAFEPDLIICDVMMPNMDGFEVLENIRSSDSTLKQVPFLFLTAKMDKVDRRQGMSLGADDYLTKPVTNEQLFSAIESRLLRRAETIKEIDETVSEKQARINHIKPHEYNTPMNGILGGIEVMKMLLDQEEELSREEMQEMLSLIKISSDRLRKTLDNSLLFNFIQNVDKEPEQKKSLSTGTCLNINSLIDQTIKDVAITYKREHDLDVHVENAFLKISCKNLKKVMEELIDNALKFSPKESEINIQGRYVRDSYELRITDRGRGMSQDEIGKIAPFQQFDRKKYEQQGLGLGLYLSEMLVQLNNGTFHIESSKPGGTSICMYLPVLETKPLINPANTQNANPT